MRNPQVIAGIGLILYSYFLTPAFWDPTDLFFTPFYITLAYATYGDLAMFIVPLWMASGYVAMVWGFVLIGSSARFLRRFHIKASYLVHHPVKVTIIAFAISLFVSLILLSSTGNL